MPKSRVYSELRLVLGDQLNELHPWFKKPKEDVLYVMMEIRPESLYVVHHIQKITGFFLAMRTFAEKLQRRGFQVKYYRIADPYNRHSFKDNLESLIRRYRIPSGAFLEPDEYRLDQLLEKAFSGLFGSYRKESTEHFYTSRTELDAFFHDRKTMVMEHFYRHMRKKYHILMNPEGSPVGGRWNYDAENRQKLPVHLEPPAPLDLEKEVTEILSDIRLAGLPSIGHIEASRFPWPADREESLRLLDHFIDRSLLHFGSYQDAMTTTSWHVYHSLLSFALNIKMISPHEVVQAVQDHWQRHKESIRIAQTEGFIRQVLGWREYMRGIYWKEMPSYEKLNYFGHSRPLPHWYWNGETGMNCLHHVIKQSLNRAYAHHIQRLMVTGNFALLAGVDPDELDRWFLGIYIDAVQWVEITNTRGMSQYADGGMVGTKPYVSSAAYIHKMSDYCEGCCYEFKKKIGELSCPFNSLYWHFYHRNREKLKQNPRVAPVYRTWDKMNESLKEDILTQAGFYLDRIESL
jgi:deoxyribodipyrimidine photolyase-related protein